MLKQYCAQLSEKREVSMYSSLVRTGRAHPDLKAKEKEGTVPPLSCSCFYNSCTCPISQSLCWHQRYISEHRQGAVFEGSQTSKEM